MPIRSHYVFPEVQSNSPPNNAHKVLARYRNGHLIGFDKLLLSRVTIQVENNSSYCIFFFFFFFFVITFNFDIAHVVEIVLRREVD